MSKDNLLKKAENNYQVAEWAEQKGLFDASVSRYYYTIYEKALYISKREGFNQDTTGRNSHQQFILGFHQDISDKLKDDEIYFLGEFDLLRTSRNTADYNNNMITENN